jgi:hypothetical protein
MNAFTRCILLMIALPYPPAEVLATEPVQTPTSYDPG